MNRVVCAGFAVLFLFFVSMALFHARADAYEDTVTTPYGDYCAECASYGVCKDEMPPQEAEKAIEKYYRKRGYRVGALNHRGRFVEAEIIKNDRKVDRVLFDRKTGRLRSVY